eukprot:366112-Chlamydomonas_euryale.AAC.30
MDTRRAVQHWQRNKFATSRRRMLTWRDYTPCTMVLDVSRTPRSSLLRSGCGDKHTVSVMMNSVSMLLVVLAACLLSNARAGDYGRNRGLKTPVPTERLSFNPSPVPTLREEDLPIAFDWGAVPDGPGGEPTSMLQPSWLVPGDLRDVCCKPTPGFCMPCSLASDSCRVLSGVVYACHPGISTFPRCEPS